MLAKTLFGKPDLPNDLEVSDLADWVELAAVAEGFFLRGSLQTAINRSEGEVTDSAALAEQAWSEVERRSQLCRGSWPLYLQGDSLRRKPRHKNSLWHLFLCTLSLGQDVEYEARRLFEYGVADVLSAITGRQSIRLGAPRGEELPRDLDSAVDAYTRLAQEEKGNRPFSPSDQDFGLDIASWRSFADGRGAYLPFIGQCATGKEWYSDHKAFELQLSMWSPHVHWAVTPVRFFAVPFVIPPQHWIRAANAGGLVLDRPRLLELGMASPLTHRRRHQIHEYCFSLASAA